MIATATVFAVPVSTTHITTTSIMGVGATRRLSAVRWGVAGNIVVAWIVTLPAAGAVAARGLLPHPRSSSADARDDRRAAAAAGRARHGAGPLAGRRHGAGVGHGVPRRHRRPGRAARRSARELGRVAVRAAVDRHRLHADPGLADPARRLARRPVRPAQGVRHRRRAGSPPPRCSAGWPRTPGSSSPPAPCRASAARCSPPAAWRSSSPRSGTRTAPGRSACGRRWPASPG